MRRRSFLAAALGAVAIGIGRPFGALEELAKPKAPPVFVTPKVIKGTISIPLDAIEPRAGAFYDVVELEMDQFKKGCAEYTDRLLWKGP